MGTLVRQELYKLMKKKSTFILFGIVTLIMILIAVVTQKNPDIFTNQENSFITGYSAFSWIVFIMIIQASTIITMEFQYGTMKNLLYRGFSRTKVLISKWITLLIYSLSLYVGTSIIAVILKMILFSDLSLTQNANGDMSVIQAFLATAAGNFVGLWMLISLVLLLSCIFRSTAVSVVIGIIFYFAVSIISGIMFLAIDKWEWLKWNPINMLNFSGQITAGEDIASMTRLSINEMLVGNIVYIGIFLFLVYAVFRKKNI